MIIIIIVFILVLFCFKTHQLGRIHFFVGLNDRKRFWAKQVNEEYIRKNAILYFYITETGVVYYGVNERSKEVLFDGVDVSTKLWAMIDVYGNSTAVQLINPKLNNTILDQVDGFDLNNSRRYIFI